MDRLIEQFVSENNFNLREGNIAYAPETADDYISLAVEAKSKKKKLST